MRKKILRITFYVLSVLLALMLVLWIYLFAVTRVSPPAINDTQALSWKREKLDSSSFKIGNNWLRRSESGLYEMYVEGAPFERGVVIGKLTKELAQYQEKVFTDQLHRIVPSGFRITLLKYFVGWFNRNLDQDVPEEYRQEIYGISTEASPEFDDIAPAYQRILNYHAAHDIGHALQNMSLVGCTSFATWSDRSADGKLLVGRNFDFYVGDDFAKNKIIAFYKPQSGYRFMMITFGGMAGVLSGMNDQGLTVTINAAKSEVPSSSATPVSLVAREILQYASTIEEAYAIAKKRKMFVSESFLIGSAKDGKAAIIEKTPEQSALVITSGDYLICTNHFQSKELGNTPLNQEHIRTSPSPYRWNRVEELLLSKSKMTVLAASDILRDQKGLEGKEIGMGNEKLINQLIAHHSIIFQPADLKVWISTTDWQLGKYVCYDLDSVFNMKAGHTGEIYDNTSTIPEDPFVKTTSYNDFLKFAQFRFPFQPHPPLVPDSLVKWNNDMYLSYLLAGDECFSRKDYRSAVGFYEQGLLKEIASLQEKTYMQEQLRKCKERTE